MLRIAMISKQMLMGYGIDEVVHKLSEEMCSRGYKVDVITTRRELKPKGYRTIIFKPQPIPVTNPYWRNHFMIDLRSITPLMKMLRNYEIVVTFDPMHLIGAIVKLKLRIPVIMYYFGVVPTGVLNSLTRKIESIRQTLIWNTSFMLADFIMTNSKYTRSLLPKGLISRTVINYHGIENMINQNIRKAKNFRENLGIQGKRVLLSVGRFSSPYKDMRGIAKIFSRLRERVKDITLLLVGRGSLREIKDFNQSKDIIVLTNVPNEMVNICYSSCDVYCSASRWEGFNIPLVAAQANGKPVVAYRVGAHPEVMIHNKTGFLAENAEDLINHLELLLRNDPLRVWMGRNATEYANKFTWKASLDLFTTVIKRLSST